MNDDKIVDEKTIDDYYQQMNKEGAVVECVAESAQDDPVSHPAHYTSHPSGVECIEIAKWYDFCIGNVIKYIWRAGLKKDSSMTDEEKELEDLKKARWYLDKEIEDREKNIKNSKK